MQLLFLLLLLVFIIIINQLLPQSHSQSLQDPIGQTALLPWQSFAMHYVNCDGLHVWSFCLTNVWWFCVIAAYDDPSLKSASQDIDTWLLMHRAWPGCIMPEFYVCVLTLFKDLLHGLVVILFIHWLHPGDFVQCVLWRFCWRRFMTGMWCLKSAHTYAREVCG